VATQATSRLHDVVFELLDVPEMRNAARSLGTFAASVSYMVGPSELESLTSTVSKGWGLSGPSGTSGSCSFLVHPRTSRNGPEPPESVP
jgi:hypothetical protein